MEREVLEEGKKTVEGRLKIRKIRKYNAASIVCGTCAFLNELLAGACAISAVYSFFQGARGKYFSGSALLTYGVCFIAITLGFISGITIPEIRDLSSDYSEKAELLKSEILESKDKCK